jgi:hypothetical protein
MSIAKWKDPFTVAMVGVYLRGIQGSGVYARTG